jgi:two-component system LytT family response regulator
MEIDLNILTIDNERLALEYLNNAIMTVEPETVLRTFFHVSEALKAVEQEGYRPNVAFLDIEMPGMTGIELAGRIKKASPETWIIFVTGFSQYALEAFSVHASGYLLKPITIDRIKEELDQVGILRTEAQKTENKLYVHCFGNFEVFYQGVPVVFSRKKSKELFAYLIHKRGASCTTRELAAVLFEDSPYDSTHQSYLQTLIVSMNHALKDIGEESIIIKTFGSLAVDTTRIDCDYYRFLNMDVSAINSYTGEYMSQYEWGEFTLDYLNQQNNL